MDPIIVTNCQQAIDTIPGMEDFLLTGIPDVQLLTSLLNLLPEPDQQMIINETDHGRKLLAKIESYQRQYASMIQDMNQQTQQIRHQSNKISMLETMLDEIRLKRRSLVQKENIYDDFR